MTQREKEIAAKGEQARALFCAGYNCAQSVLGAFAEETGMEQKLLLRLAEGLGAGMGRMRLTCGAVAAMSVLAGLKDSSGAPGDLDGRAHIYALVREMAEQFRAKNGSVICGELLGASRPADESARPEARTAEYYKKRPCPEIVRQCAEIAHAKLFAGEGSAED